MPVPPPAEQMPEDTWHCGDLLIDRRARRLSRQDRPVSLGSRAFDLLMALIDGRDTMQSADALRAAVWPGRKVGDNNLRVQMSQLRRLLGAGAIVHRAGHGYLLAVPVHQVDGKAGAQPAARTAGNLPEAAWPLVGRAALLQEVVQRLRTGCRCTLVGAGGVGKTALAGSAAGLAASAFSDGVWWVDLAAVRDAGQVADAVSTALQLSANRQAPLDRLVERLAPSQCLLVLDNCEHLRPAVTELCDRLARAARGVAVLATSRVPLRSAGEELLSVPSLSLPPAGTVCPWPLAGPCDALRLFESRARIADPRFRLTPANLPTVLDICRRLDGHALAITLAAARLPLLGLQALSAGLDERLRWTQRATSDQASPQHLSLQGTLDWTYDLLTRPQQALLRRLGVFVGSFTRAAANAVAARPQAPTLEPQDALEALVAHGLVTLDADGLLGTETSEARYTMHEATRLYAHERLLAAGEADAARLALTQHLIEVLGTERDRTQRASRPPPIHVLPDVQAMVQWACEPQPALALVLCRHGADLWRRRGQHRLVRQLATPLLAAPQTQQHVIERVRLLVMLCLVEYEVEDTASVLAHAQEVLELLGPAGDPECRGAALSWQCNVMCWNADAGGDGSHLVRVEPLYRQALELFRQAGSAARVRETLNNLGWALQAQGQFAEGRILLHEALALSEAASDTWCLTLAHENLGELELRAGAWAAAVRHLESAAVLARRGVDRFRLAFADAMLGHALVGMGAHGRALAVAREALQMSIEHGFLRLQASACAAIAAALSARGDMKRAHAVLQATRRCRAREGFAGGSLHDALESAVERQTVPVLEAADRAAAEARGDLLLPSEILDWATEGSTEPALVHASGR